MTIAHKDVPLIDNHHPYRWIFNNASDRLAASTTADDLYKRALQLDNETEYILISNTPTRWKEINTITSVPTTVIARLNPSPVITLAEDMSINPNYSCLSLTSMSAITLISTPNIRSATYNAQELTLMYLGDYSIMFLSKNDLPDSQLLNGFVLNTSNRVKKLVFSKVLDLWLSY